MKHETIQIINNLVTLIYDLYPDEEFEELYQVKQKIAEAQAFVDKLQVGE